MEGYKQDGSILATCKSSVVATELNPVVPKETFDIDWPPGTTVYSFLTRPATKFVVPRKK